METLSALQLLDYGNDLSCSFIQRWELPPGESRLLFTIVELSYNAPNLPTRSDIDFRGTLKLDNLLQRS